VIQRIEHVTPAAAWVALGTLLVLALLLGATAIRTSIIARRRSSEIAAVSEAALTDPLTGVLNRRGFTEAVERELDRARRYNRGFALAFVDVRGLKHVNDTQGHLAGDELLRQTAGMLRESARGHDVVGRIGGDELGVLLVEQSAEAAPAVVDRIRLRVHARRQTSGPLDDWNLTIGTATYPEDGETFEGLLEAADRRLYEQRGIALR
jgi:diguanylate cyclase (GGDEF)-like protein